MNKIMEINLKMYHFLSCLQTLFVYLRITLTILRIFDEMWAINRDRNLFCEKHLDKDNGFSKKKKIHYSTS